MSTTTENNSKSYLSEEETGVVSYANIEGEWNDRPLSLFGAVKSFYNQLTTGMDVTRISMPCAFFKPYSLLEEIAAKNMAHINLLPFIAQEPNPLLRILGLGQWLLTSTKQQKFSHKPFNPVIGEIHRSKVIHKKSADAKADDSKPNQTYMVCEQVEHHPPTCSYELTIHTMDYKLKVSTLLVLNLVETLYL